MKIRWLLAAFFAFLSILGCRKVNLADSERIANTWKLGRYVVNGMDKTGSLLVSDFTEKIEDYDFYGYSYWCINATQDSIVERGSSYQLYANGDSILFYASYQIPLTIDDTIWHYRRCKILRLSPTALVYEFRLNGSLHEFEMEALKP
jgi:hypothetical protein